MSSQASSNPTQLEIPNNKSWFNWILLGCIAFALAWSWKGAEMDPGMLIHERQHIWTHFNDYIPPNFEEWRLYLEEMMVTLKIAIWGTFLAVVLSIPFGVMSSENIVPTWVYQPVRRLMDAARAINELVFALLFVAAVGLGPFAGVMALFIHTTGVLAKLFSEAVEAIDLEPVEGVRATGANKIHEVIYGVIPQVMPLWISYSLYRFESNLRSATVLGIVGAGGIGVLLFESMRGFSYPEAAAIIIIIIISVSITDLISQLIRRRFI